MPNNPPLRAVHPVETVLSKVIVIGENNKRAIDQVDEGLARVEKKVDAIDAKLVVGLAKQDSIATRMFIGFVLVSILCLVSITMSVVVLLHETQAKPVMLVPYSQDKLNSLK